LKECGRKAKGPDAIRGSAMFLRGGNSDEAAVRVPFADVKQLRAAAKRGIRYAREV